ncbi:unnamed protein product [Cuscuta epithymum]|uniref:Uncharacterized protein n=1 Tax=Cuscuta epithymum TaxID=186058 RepID=A0AAV0CB61_9ASTE|nr:unnamed protein product [Cuscuta epithymum]
MLSNNQVGWISLVERPETQKSGGSKWLDRLRSSKGFPHSDFVNLEHFLLHHTSTSLNSPPINPALPRSEDISSELCSNGAELEKEPVLEASVDDRGTKLVNAFSHVLSELFNMGESSNYAAHKKESRKQSNPRIFSAFTSVEFSNVSGSRDERGKQRIASPISDDQTRVEMNGQVKLLEQGQDLVVSEERMDANLLGYSRCEVTVIDTSCAPWKFDKLLFRKKTAWKVCDKRTNTLYLGKKKKRDVSAEDNNVGGMKKQNVSIGEESKFLNLEGLQPLDKLEDACKKKSNPVGSSQEKNMDL